MKIELLRKQACPGSRVSLLLISGDEIDCEIVEFGLGHVLVEDRGRQRRFFDEAITGFEVLESTEKTSERNPTDLEAQMRPAEYEPETRASRHEINSPASLDTGATTTQQTLAWTSALQYADSVRAALKSEPAKLDESVDAARELANRYAYSPMQIQRDSNVRFALIQVFKALESERQSGNEAREEAVSLKLSEGMLQLNAALRLAEGMPPEQRFTDLYHFYAAIRPHLDHFLAQPQTRVQLREALNEARELADEIINDRRINDLWEKQPFRRASFYRRLSAMCQQLVEGGFAPEKERARLLSQAQEFAAKATGQRGNESAVRPAMGQIVSYGSHLFGFIEASAGRTFYFRLDDVLAEVIRQTLVTSNGELDIEVDFDERPMESGRKYPRAVGIRPPGTVLGEIENIGPTFGFIALPDGRKVYFHTENLRPSEVVLSVGSAVVCRPFPVPYRCGWESSEVFAITQPDRSYPRSIGPRSQSDSAVRSPFSPADGALQADPAQLLEEAIRFRRDQDPESAVQLYEQGIHDCPTPSLFLSYAAMRRDEHDSRAALKILERGIVKIPDSPKLHEDAGLAARDIGDWTRALRHLHTALDLCRNSGKPGEKGVLLALARTYYRMERLSEAQKYYEEAVHSFGGFKLPFEMDERQLGITRICLHHDRGQKTVRFLKNAGLEIVHAAFLDEQRSGAELIVRTSSEELIESYGLQKSERRGVARKLPGSELVGQYRFSSQFLVRCYFKAKLTRADIDDFEAHIKTAATDGDSDEQTALLIGASFNEPMLEFLDKRLNEPRKVRPAIVPIRQEDLEATKEAVTALRSVLDRWLYGRDLFALKDPVVGPRFFGRANALANLRDAIVHGEPVGVWGLRRIGKTSLLKETERRASAGGDIVAMVDLHNFPADAPDTGWLAWNLADKLRQSADAAGLKSIAWRLGGVFASELDIPPKFRVATAFSDDLASLVRAVRESKARPRPKIVLILDEVETLVPTAINPSLKGSFDFLKNLRGATQSANGDIAWIVTAANASISEIGHFGHRDNPVFGFFRDVYLQMLEPQECADMIRTLGRGMGMKFNEPALARIYEMTGGHPFITRHFCSFMHQRHAKRPLHVTLEIVDPLPSPFLDHKSDLFKEIYGRLSRDYPHDARAVVELARRGGRMTLGDLQGFDSSSTEDVLKHLRSYQIIDVRDGWVSFSIDLLRQWLLRKHGEG